MTKDDTTKDPAAKRAAIALLTKGLITRAEAAKLAGVSRQLARHWAKDIPEQNRDAVITKLWSKELAKNRSGERS
jgi:hypothetical protein